MNTNKLTIFQLRAIIDFLKENISTETLTAEGVLSKYLLLAFVKMQRELDNWEEAIKYTD